MTTPGVRHRHASVIRIIAASLCFDTNPPVIKQLAKAREAAEQIYGALVGAGMIDADPDYDVGPAAPDGANGADVPLFPAQPGDPET